MNSRAYRPSPRRRRRRGVAFAETLAAVLLIAPAYRAAGAWLAAAIFGAYLALIARATLEQREVDCGCSFGRGRRAPGAFEATRNGVLVMLAMLAALSSAGGALPVAASQAGGVRAVRAVRRAGSSHGAGANAQGRRAMSFVIASQIALWAAILVLAVVCIALARQVGVLHQRIAPAGALALQATLEARRGGAGDDARRPGWIWRQDRRRARRTKPAPALHIAGLRGLRGAPARRALRAGRGTRLARHRARERRRARAARAVRARTRVCRDFPMCCRSIWAAASASRSSPTRR